MGYDQVKEVSTSSLAIASLVVGLTMAWCCPVFGAAAAFIMAFMALGRIGASGGTLKGAGLAKAGIVLACMAVASQIWFCFFMKGVYEKASPVCERFLQALDRVDIDGAYVECHPAFKKAVPPEKLEAIAKKIKEGLGDYKGKRWGWTLNYNYSSGGWIIQVVYTLKYAKDEAPGRFTLRDEDSGVKIQGFFVNSARLN